MLFYRFALSDSIDCGPDSMCLRTRTKCGKVVGNGQSLTQNSYLHELDHMRLNGAGVPSLCGLSLRWATVASL